MSGSVLVTGGAGFIGSHLVTLLLSKGYRVRVLDNLSQGHREWVDPAAELIVADVEDPEACRAACAGVQGVFHLAAMSRSAASLDQGELCTRSNVLGTHMILEAARQAGVGKVVYAGSATYYGSQPIPHREDLPGDFLNLYGLTKHVGESYCLLYDQLYGLPTVVLRFFNVYGSRQPTTGAYALVLGIFLERKRRGLPLEIHGDGSQRRDFVHVRDVARAAWMAYEGAVRGQVLNVGSGTNLSVRELADLISPLQQFTPPRPADSTATLADIGRIRQALGWEPEVSFEEGLRELEQEG